MFRVADNQQHFTYQDKPTFYLADTCWSAFTNIDESDWEYYLNYRKEQGFNVLQINMLPQWDASATVFDYKPYPISEEGKLLINEPNSAYFDRAERMIKAAKEKGITIALVLLWCNYLPDTWATKMRKTDLFPEEDLDTYIQFVVNRFDKYHPIYVISGDTDFPSQQVIENYYLKALQLVKSLAPQALTTLHIRGREAALPDILRESPDLDFYMFQSGHNSAFQATAYTLAETFSAMSPKRPSLNSEPCYEMMGYSRRVYGRFSREDVRKAAWQSVLSGASSGVTYGAHGIWSWHNEEMVFDSSVGEAFETPYDWHDALKFEGAWDYGFIRSFMEEQCLLDLVPYQELLINEVPDIRVSKGNHKIVLYIPSNITLKLAGNFEGAEMTYLDLETKKTMPAQGAYFEEAGFTKVKMHRFLKDALLIINLP